MSLEFKRHRISTTSFASAADMAATVNHGVGAPARRRGLAYKSRRMADENKRPVDRRVRRNAMTRHWIITDLDGSNPRHVDMCEYVEALERRERFIVNCVVYRDMRRPSGTLAPATLAQASLDLD
jgi:hypothetical protein